MPRPHRPDWTCPGCSASVFGSKDRCFKCGIPNPALPAAAATPPPVVPAAVPLRRPDWTCPTCAVLVFGSKDRCFKCNAVNPGIATTTAAATIAPPLPAAAVPAVAARDHHLSDWNCPTCHFSVYGSKDRCGKCGILNPALSSQQGATATTSSAPARRPDWTCPGCKAVVFGSKDRCFRCGKSCPNSSAAAAAPMKAGQLPDWKCPGCKATVFGSRAGCYKCGQPNPSLAGVLGATPSASGPGGTTNEPALLAKREAALRLMEASLRAREEALLNQPVAQGGAGAAVNASCSGVRLAVTPPPPYWDLSVSDGFPSVGAHRVVIDDPADIAALEDLVNATNTSRTTSQAVVPPRRTVLRAWRIQNDRLWIHYCTNRDLMVTDGITPVTTLTQACEVKRPRDVATHLFTVAKVNEAYLWHGTSVTTVPIICDEGFDERVCSLSGCYGGGVYFAEASSKSLGYAGATSSRLSGAEWGPEPFPAAAAKAAPTVQHVFLARVCVGRFKEIINTTASSIRRAPDGNDSVIGQPSAGAPREFVVYDRRQTYPEYLLEIA